MKILSYMVEAHIFRMNGNEPEFLMLKRSEKEVYPGVWQMVTGSSNQNEKALHTAIREIREETGLEPERLWVIPHINSFFSYKRNHISLVPVFAAQVNFNSNVKLSHEHSEYKWGSRLEVLECVAWAGQRSSVDYIYEFLTKKSCSLRFEEINIPKLKLSIKSAKSS